VSDSRRPLPDPASHPPRSVLSPHPLPPGTPALDRLAPPPGPPRRRDPRSLWAPEASFQAHAGESVSAVAWAPQRFGCVMAVATCSGSLSVWERVPLAGKGPGQARWEQRALFEEEDSASEIAALEFAPGVHGLLLAAGSRDGYVRMYEPADGTSDWALAAALSAGFGVGGAPGPDGVTGLAWRPQLSSDGVQAMLACATAPEERPGGAPRHVPAAAGGSCSVWVWHRDAGRWARAAAVVGGPCGAVAWSPATGRGFETLAVARGASVSVVAVEGPADQLTCRELQSLEHRAPVWRAEWDVLGTALACSTEDAGVTMWELNLDGRFSGARMDRGWIAEQRDLAARGGDGAMDD